jgi:cytochrome c5
MTLPRIAISCGFLALAGLAFAVVGPPEHHQRSAADHSLAAVGAPTPAQAAASPSDVTAAGVTLRSVAVDLPDRGVTFPGPGSDAVNNNCLTCHSAGMVLNQPKMSRMAWEGEVEKMIGTYKAPVAQGDVGAIVDYLANLKGVN